MPTAPEEVSPRRLKRARAGRRAFFIFLCLLLGAAALGWLGVRTKEVRASGGGYELVATYPEITRPGLATAWSVEITRAGGFERVITVAVESAYFDSFDENALDPDPLSATADDEKTIWTFEPPPEGDVLTVSFDARIEPGIQLKRVKGSLAVLEEGQEVAIVRFETWVLP